jgi:hypothetical protein
MTTPAAHRLGTAIWAALAGTLFALAVGTSAASTTRVYKCFDKTLGVLYTDEPCKDAEVLNIRAGDADPAAVAWLQRERDALDRSATQRITDQRRAALQRTLVAQPAYLPDEDFRGYAIEPAYVPYGAYAVVPYSLHRDRHATGARSPKGLERSRVVPNPPRAAPRM